ncbi:MAG: HDOD domain-containing protein [Rubrivivax sp.]
MQPREVVFIQQPPGSLAAWADTFDWDALPVLGETAAEIVRWREREDEVDAHRLAEFVCRDPFLTVKLFSYLASLRSGREDTLPETVTGCLLMLGIPPFFTKFSKLSTVESELALDPGAIDELRSVLARSRRAADFALAFAVHRMDHDASLIYSAALLHEFAELLLWLRAPSLAGEIARRQRILPQLRSVDAQKAVLRITLGDLQRELMARWHLPQALTSLVNPDVNGHSAQALTVELATRVARHSARGWENPAIPDDIRDISELLQMGSEPTRHLLMDIDA